jgi:phage shock protein C
VASGDMSTAGPVPGFTCRAVGWPSDAARTGTPLAAGRRPQRDAARCVDCLRAATAAPDHLGASGMTKQLVRSAENRIIGGVCGGLGEYLGVDPTIIRLVWVLFVLAGGGGLVLYPLAWFLIPDTEGRRDPLPLVILVALLVFPGSCCLLSWFGALGGSMFGVGR